MNTNCTYVHITQHVPYQRLYPMQGIKCLVTCCFNGSVYESDDFNKSLTSSIATSLVKELVIFLLPGKFNSMLM